MKFFDSARMIILGKTSLLFFTILILLMSSCKKEDKTNPAITLTGKDTIMINLNDNWQDPGYTALDNKDGDITSKVIVNGTVDTKFIYEYILEYKVEDNAGNEAAVTRVVFVKTDSLQGNYHVNDVVEGVNQGNYSYTVIVTPGPEYNTIVIKNFANLGSAVNVSARIDGVTMLISQNLTGVNPGYEGSITGIGNYDGTLKKITQLEYFITYQAGGMDHGMCTLNKN